MLAGREGFRSVQFLGAGVGDSVRVGAEGPVLHLWASCRLVCHGIFGQLHVTWKCHSE